jgi:Zn-dependent protease
MNTYKFKLFNFVGAPVELNLFFLILFAFTSIEIGIAIFLSVLVHEMAHAWMANKKGYKVYGIEINLFSGSASMDSNMHERDSVPIIAAGPISNLLLFIIATSIYYIYPNSFINSLSWVNLLLFSFNILPIYPMDGGQILNDILVRKTNRSLSIKVTSIVSIIFATILAITSLFYGYFIMSIFSLYFIYISLKRINLF